MIRSADKSKIKCGPTKTIGIFSSTLFLQCILPMPNIVLKGLKAICWKFIKNICGLSIKWFKY